MSIAPRFERLAILAGLTAMAWGTPASQADAAPPAADAVRTAVGPTSPICPMCALVVADRKAVGPGSSPCPTCVLTGAAADRKAVGPRVPICPNCVVHGNATAGRKVVGPIIPGCPDCIPSGQVVADRKTVGPTLSLCPSCVGRAVAGPKVVGPGDTRKLKSNKTARACPATAPLDLNRSM